MKANATDLPQPAPVTALYRAHALGLIRLAVVMLGDRPAASMRISRGTVKSTTSRALAALGRILGEQQS